MWLLGRPFGPLLHVRWISWLSNSISKIISVMAFLNNWFELRGDAFKIIHHTRRPLPQRIVMVTCRRLLSNGASLKNVEIHMSRPKFAFLRVAMPVPEIIRPYVVKFDPGTTHLTQNTMCVEFLYPHILFECIQTSRFGFLVYARSGRWLSHLWLGRFSFLRLGDWDRVRSRWFRWSSFLLLNFLS